MLIDKLFDFTLLLFMDLKFSNGRNLVFESPSGRINFHVSFDGFPRHTILA